MCVWHFSVYVCVSACGTTDGQVPSYSDRLSFLLLNNRGKSRGQDKRRNKDGEKDWAASKWPEITSCFVPGGLIQCDR